MRKVHDFLNSWCCLQMALNTEQWFLLTKLSPAMFVSLVAVLSATSIHCPDRGPARRPEGKRKRRNNMISWSTLQAALLLSFQKQQPEESSWKCSRPQHSSSFCQMASYQLLICSWNLKYSSRPSEYNYSSTHPFLQVEDKHCIFVHSDILKQGDRST